MQTKVCFSHLYFDIVTSLTRVRNGQDRGSIKIPKLSAPSLTRARLADTVADDNPNKRNTRVTVTNNGSRL
jgi:archaellum component FlaF (FlaF/FlaG flagellin family)